MNIQKDATEPIPEQDTQARRKLRGAPLAEYVPLTPDPEDTLLGDRYLCRGGGMFIVAPSGIGKRVVRPGSYSMEYRPGSFWD